MEEKHDIVTSVFSKQSIMIRIADRKRAWTTDLGDSRPLTKHDIPAVPFHSMAKRPQCCRFADLAGDQSKQSITIRIADRKRA